MDIEIIKKLIQTANNMRNFAYTPYSHYTVGAALLTQDDIVFSGCNIENASFSPTVCAERVAVFKAISEGQTNFKAIAICAGRKGETSNAYPSPCGVCRQVLREFSDPKKFIVILAKSETDYLSYTLDELLPESFGPQRLL